MAWNLVTQHYFRTPLVGFTSRIHLIDRLSNIESFQMNSGLCRNSQRRKLTTMRVFIRGRDWGRGSEAPQKFKFLKFIQEKYRKYALNPPSLTNFNIPRAPFPLLKKIMVSRMSHYICRLIQCVLYMPVHVHVYVRVYIIIVFL